MLLARRFCTPSLRTVVSKYATLSVQSPRRLWSSLLCNSLQRVYEGDVKPVNTICRPMLHNSCLRSGTRRGFVSEAPKVDGLSHSSAATKTDEENLSENELKELEALSQDASAFSATTDAYNPEEVDQLFGTAGTEPPPLQLPDIPITGTTPCRWVIEGDHGNPYRFDILDLTHVIAESDTSAVAHGNSPATEQSLEEVGESFQNLASSLFGPGGVLEGSDSPDNEFVKTNKQAGMSSRDAAAAGAAAQRAALEGRNRESFQQNTVLFEPPLVVRFPVPRALYQDIKQVFTTKLDETTSASSPSSSTSLSSSGNKGPPPMRTLQKARDSGGRYDVYLTGQEGRILFFASTACLANRSLLPDDGSVALERHHVVTLREQPRLVPVPAALMTSSTAAATTTTTTTTSMSSSVVSRDTQEADATIEAVLEFECTSVTSTFDSMDVYGAPSESMSFRKREVDFLLRNVIFGVSLPAPVPPQFTSYLQDDLSTNLDPKESQTRRELMARYVIGLYGCGADSASLRSPIDYPSVHEAQLGNDVNLTLLYDDPSKYFPPR